MHQIRFRLGLPPPVPAGGAYSVPPNPLAGFGAASWQGGDAGLGKGTERGRGRGGRGKWRERKGGPQVTVEPGPLTALLRH